MTEAKKAPAPKAEEKDLWGDEGSVDMAYQKWETVGDKLRAVYVARRKNTTKDKYGHLNLEYIFVKEDGERIRVQGRNYGRGQEAGQGFYRQIFGMSDIPLGADMGLLYAEDRKNDTPNPTKIITPKWLGDKKMDVLKAYQDRWGVETEVSEETEEESKEEQIDEKEIAF